MTELATIRRAALDEARQVCIAVSRQHRARAAALPPGAEKNEELWAAMIAFDCVAEIAGLMLMRPTGVAPEVGRVLARNA